MKRDFQICTVIDRQSLGMQAYSKAWAFKRVILLPQIKLSGGENDETPSVISGSYLFSCNNDTVFPRFETFCKVSFGPRWESQGRQDTEVVTCGGIFWSM